MFASTLWWDRCHGAFKDFQQGLLDAFARYVTSDRRVLRFPRNLVNLVNIDDATFSFGYIVIRRLNKLQQDVLHILADVASLGKRGRVSDNERHIELSSQRLGQVGFA